LDYYWKQTNGFTNHSSNANMFFQWASGTSIGPSRTFTEEPRGVGCPNFITAAGGVLHLLWAGFAGLHVQADALVFSYPFPPPGATGL